MARQPSTSLLSYLVYFYVSYDHNVREEKSNVNNCPTKWSWCSAPYTSVHHHFSLISHQRGHCYSSSSSSRSSGRNALRFPSLSLSTLSYAHTGMASYPYLNPSIQQKQTVQHKITTSSIDFFLLRANKLREQSSLQSRSECCLLHPSYIPRAAPAALRTSALYTCEWPIIQIIINGSCGPSHSS